MSNTSHATATLIEPPQALPLNQDHSHPMHDLRRSRPWLLLLLALVVTRLLLLPFTVTDAGITYMRILDSLLAGQTWGRQALVGSFEYAPLPTLALMLTSALAQFSASIDAAELLTAIAQVWAAYYLLRCIPTLQRRLLGAAVIALIIAAVPAARTMLSSADPNWITVVPLLSIIYHLNCWYRKAALRDWILIAINAGLLCFAGTVAGAAAAAIVLLLSWQLHRNQQLPANDKEGLCLLIWMPLIYALGLVILGNWLILSQPFFLVIEPLRIISAIDTPLLLPLIWQQAQAILPLTALLLPLAVVLRQPQHRSMLLPLLLAIAVTIPLTVLLLAVKLAAPAGMLIIAALFLTAPILVIAQAGRSRIADFAATVLGILGLAIVMAMAPSLPQPASFHTTAPAADDILDWIDHSWPQARVKLYGVRAPACFADLHEKRFQARLDFHEQLFLDQAADEQLYLLLPPQQAGFYAADNHGLHNIYNHGRPWLILERQWSSGWQLWRCVIAPQGKSLLDQTAPLHH